MTTNRVPPKEFGKGQRPRWQRVAEAVTRDFHIILGSALWVCVIVAAITGRAWLAYGAGQLAASVYIISTAYYRLVVFRLKREILTLLDLVMMQDKSRRN